MPCGALVPELVRGKGRGFRAGNTSSLVTRAGQSGTGTPVQEELPLWCGSRYGRAGARDEEGGGWLGPAKCRAVGLGVWGIGSAAVLRAEGTRRGWGPGRVGLNAFRPGPSADWMVRSPPGKVCCAILVPGNRAQRGQSQGRWRRGFGGTRSRERKRGERPESIAAVCFLSTY